MKKRYLFKIDVWFLTIIFILLSIVYNSFFTLAIFYLLTFIHELGHFLFAKLFNVKCYKINFHPLGFSLEMENISFIKPYKQLLILLGGPLTFFVNLIIISILFKFNLLSIYQYNIAIENNLSLLIFNMIPFYPLDGGRILEVILFNYMDSKKTKYTILIISSLISIILLILCLLNNQILLFVFILYSLISSILFFNKEYNQYLYSRIGNISLFDKNIVNKKQFFHFKHNYFKENDKIQDEEDYILNLKIKDVEKLYKNTDKNKFYKKMLKK